MKDFLLLIAATIITAVLCYLGVAFVTWGGDFSTITSDQRGAVTFIFVLVSLIIWLVLCNIDYNEK